MFTFDIDDKEKIKKIHFIGIGGISMSGIALLLHENGFEITGSDRSPNPHTKHLEDLGVKISYEQTGENIKDPDLVIYTDAILDDNEELVRAKELDGVDVVTRGVFLGALMRNYKHSIAISGSHGKSTVTSMISSVMVGTKYKPSILLGGDLDAIKGNSLAGDRDYLVSEACEYKANILNFYPSTAIVLNIEADHLDFYKDLDAIIETFQGFLDNMDEDSNTIINIDDKNCLELLDHVKGRLYTFGMENPKADFNIKNVSHDDMGRPSFSLEDPSGKKLDFKLKVLGDFNIYNAAATAISLLVTGVDEDTIVKGIDSYTSLHRRMEIVGHYNGGYVMTDYGHHPTEIKSTLKALADHKKGRLICVFQPHTYSRTKALMDDFAKAFDRADEVVVTDIYAAREKFDPTVHSKDLVKKMQDRGINAKYLGDFDQAQEYVRSILGEDDLVLTTGCGNPHILAYMIAEEDHELI